MKRTIVVALVAVLALFAWAPAPATADAATVAQKAKAKKKGKPKAKCPAKKKGAARTSLADASAKKKAAKCKKAKSKKPAPKPKPRSNAGLTDGTYDDGDFTVELSGDRTKVAVTTPASSCAGRVPLRLDGPFSLSKGGGRGGSEQKVGGGAATVKWSIRIAADLSYVYTADWKVQFPDSAPCQDDVRRTGRLSR